MKNHITAGPQGKYLQTLIAIENIVCFFCVDLLFLGPLRRKNKLKNTSVNMKKALIMCSSM